MAALLLFAAGSALWMLWQAATPPLPGADALFPWQQQRLQILLAVGGIWLLLLATLLFVGWRSRQPATAGTRKWPSWLVPLLLTIFILAFMAAYGWLAVTRHQRFNSTGYDLAINEQIVWNTVHGRFFASSLEVDNSFADHFRPFLLALAPFYLLFQSPLTLLLVQTAGLALGAIPLYLLARERLQQRLVPLVIAAVYLLYPALGFIARFDFHVEAFAIPAFFAAFYAMERERWGWASAWLLIPLLVKESMGLTVAAVGLYALVMRRKARWGSAWLVLGLATFAVTSFWLIPTVRGEASDTLSRYRWLGDAPGTMLATLFTEPALVWQQLTSADRLFYLLQLLVPVGFLALLGLPELFLALPGLGLNLLASHHCQPTIYCQYTVPVLPFVLVATVFGLGTLRHLLRRHPAWQLAGLGLLPLALFSLWVDTPFTETEALPDALAPPGNAEVVRAALAVVPEAGTAVTSNDYAPHLARRQELYVIGNPSQREAPADPEVVFLNLYDQEYIVCDQYRAYVARLDPARYGVTFRTGGVIVIQQDAGDNALFRDFIENWNNCAG